MHLTGGSGEAKWFDCINEFFNECIQVMECCTDLPMNMHKGLSVNHVVWRRTGTCRLMVE